MQGLLTYHNERPEGFDLIGLADPFLGALGYILEEVGLEIILELLTGLLELL
jgi:hypothetical protein